MIGTGAARRGRHPAIGGIAVLLVLLIGSVPSARAELVERGDLFVKFSGGISPPALPRERRAPIAIEVAGTIKTLSGSRPPALRQISIAINRNGHLDTTGLPVCHQAQINPASSAVALAECRDALVGEGSYLANTAFPEQETFPSRGHILAFNAVSQGHEAILAHVYTAKPAPITRVIVFHIHHREKGAYGTTLSGSFPVSINRYGYLRRISLNLFRRFKYRGRTHSYLSAPCAAPAGFPGAVFPFAHASMAFEDGRTLSSSLTRSCRVR